MTLEIHAVDDLSQAFDVGPLFFAFENDDELFFLVQHISDLYFSFQHCEAQVLAASHHEAVIDLRSHLMWLAEREDDRPRVESRFEGIIYEAVDVLLQRVEAVGRQVLLLDAQAGLRGFHLLQKQHVSRVQLDDSLLRLFEDFVFTFGSSFVVRSFFFRVDEVFEERAELEAFECPHLGLVIHDERVEHLFVEVVDQSVSNELTETRLV